MIKRFLPHQANAVAVLILLLKKINIQVSSYTIEKVLNDHPHYPSLLAVSDSLTHWNIPHEAYQIDKATCKVDNLSVPFIVHFGTSSSRFILVHEITNGQVQYSDEEENRTNLSEIKFLKRWDGVLLC